MRTPIVAGNWKMNKTVEQARGPGCRNGARSAGHRQGGKVFCARPLLALMPISAMLAGTGIGLGAQNLHWEASGAFTGEVAPAMVKEFCQYVILGHSERRAYFGETDETVNRKVKAALGSGLTPIVCVGETLAEYESGITAEVVIRQIVAGSEGSDREQGRALVIAYEPVWAIGTGRASKLPQPIRLLPI